MHRFCCFLGRFIFSGSFVLLAAVIPSLQASAHPLGFSYNSYPLDWQWANYDGVPNEEFGINVDAYFGFGFSLDPSAVLDNRHYTISDFTVTLPPGIGDEYFLQADATGQIDLSPEGSILAWDFSYTLTNFLPPLEGPDAWRNSYLKVTSQAGPGSCNCDTLRMDYYLSYQRQDQIIPLGPVEIFYRHTNDLANWQVQEVPAPAPRLLFAIGALIIAMRHRRRKFFSIFLFGLRPKELV